MPGGLLGLAHLVTPDHVQDGLAFSLAQRQQEAREVVAGDDALHFELEAPVGALGPGFLEQGRHGDGEPFRAVAPGVSEALITTAAGIFVAVPSVVGYNQLNARLREFAAHMDDFAREVLNAMEGVPTVAPPPLTSAIPEETLRGVHR